MKTVLKKAPNLIVVCATVIVGLTIIAVTVLIALGRSSDEITHIITVILNGLGALSGGGALLYAAASAKSGENVEEQLNGKFDARIRLAVRRVMLEVSQSDESSRDGQR